MFLATSLFAGQAYAAGNMDRFIGQKHSLILATSDTDNSHDKPIFAEASSKSKKIFKLQGRSCVVCDMSGMQKGQDYKFVKVKLPNCKPSSGYVRVSDYKFDILSTDDFGLSGNEKNVEKRIKACKATLKYIGRTYGSHHHFVCMSLLNKAYQAAGYNFNAPHARSYNQSKYGKRIKKDQLAAGDIVFYKGVHGGNHNHVGLYLGKGYVIQSTCDKGKHYPRAGVRITKLKFRSSPTDYRSPF